MGRDRSEQATPDLFSTEMVRDGSPSPIEPIPATQPTADASSQRHVLPKNLRTAVKHLSDAELDLLHAAILEEMGRRGRLVPDVQTTKPSARTSKSSSGRQVKAATVSLTRGQINAVRAAFKPHAYLLGTHTRPSSITIFGISGGAKRWLKIPLDLAQPPVTFATQALGFVRQTPVVPFFGPTTGFVINYTPDRAVRFDLEGNPVECLPCAYFPGDVTLTLGNRKMAAEEFARIAGLRRTDDA